MGRIFLFLLTVGISLFVARHLGYLGEGEVKMPLPGTQAAAAKGKTMPLPDLGGDLFEKKPLPNKATNLVDVKLGRDPIVISGHLEPQENFDASGATEGTILFVGEEIPSGAIQVAGVAPFLPEPCNIAKVKIVETKVIKQGNSEIEKDVEYVNREIQKVYLKLMKGQMVHTDQVLVVLDPANALTELSAKKLKFDSALAKSRAAEATAKESESNYNRARDLKARGAIAEYEFSVAFLTYLRAYEESVGEKVAVKQAQNEMEAAQMKLNQHTIENRIIANRSVIKDIVKQRGEFCRPSEKIMELHSIDRFLAEGALDSQFRDRVRVGMTVTIEPTLEESPERVLKAHKAEITAVAVTQDQKVVSASEDRMVCVWDKYNLGPVRVFLHPDPVRALAVSPMGSPHNYIVAGCADGKIYIWDLKNPKNELLFQKPIEAHRDPVTAIAISPDGKFFATGSADNTIRIYNFTDDKVVYAFDREHGATNPHTGPITSLQFTPQCKLISASRDNTLRVWNLHQNGVEMSGEPVDGRTGNVAHLGVSSDGQWMLFERGKMLQILSVADRLPVNSIQTPGGAVPFETVALFSPDSSLVLTAGQAEGRLQLWSTPTATTRGFEVRQLVTRERTPATCAAFAPWQGQPNRPGFAVTGNTEGDVYIWPIPTTEQVANHRMKNIKITNVNMTIDANRQIKVTAEVPNQFSAEYPNGRLLAGRAVTMVINEE